MPTSTLAERSLRQLVDCGERPFPSHPRVERYFPAAAIEDARRRLGRAIERGDGPGLVIGAAGMGKTLLMQALAAQFHERYDVVLLGCARLCTRRALLQAILFELGLPHRLRDEGRLRLALLEHLLSSKQAPTVLLLLVDEAQTLPVALLDELRVMTNLADRGVPLVRLVLAGSPVLEETFASAELESLSQRLGARGYLSPFSREETAQYIRAQLHASGAAVDEVLRPEAWEAVFEATDGVPRLVNQLCDRAILVATEEKCLRLDRRVIQDAWADLQQLPLPWQTPAAGVGAPTAESVVEFGSLVEDTPPHVVLPTAKETGRENSLPPKPAAAVVEVHTPNPTATGSVCAPQRPRRDLADPFDEAFEEEEVVIDSFASIQHLFAKATPPVVNRRDATFAALARAAIDAASVPAVDITSQSTSPQAAFAEQEQTPGEPISIASEDFLPRFEKAAQTTSPYDAFPIVDDSDSAHSPVGRIPNPDDLIDDFDSHWPPIRLAFADADEESDETAPLEVKPRQDISTGGRHSSDESPILIVDDEDDGGPRGPSRDRSQSGVRRQEYRRLFSRLRSG